MLKTGEFNKKSKDNFTVVLSVYSEGCELGDAVRCSHRGWLSREVAYAVFKEAGLYEFDELPKLIRVAKKLLKEGKLNPENIRKDVVV